jgi:NADH:ubiquinone oxidoreductase subunit D
MHTAYIRPGGVAYDTYRFIERYYDFLLPFSESLPNRRIAQ